VFVSLQTSTIVAAAKRMYGSAAAYSSMALELNASDARGIDVSIYWRKTLPLFYCCNTIIVYHLNG
jgi:hypothetical protein